MPYKKGETDEPVDSSKNLIKDHKTSGAVIIASSKQIKDDDDNPPHYPAKKEYVKLIGSDKFVSLAEEPDSKNPKPVVYEVTSSGFQRKDKNQQTGSAGAAVGSSGTTGRKSTYGSK